MFIKVDNLLIRYNQDVIIKDISICFRSNELWAICGANGIGKSSLIKTIIGINKYTSGSISFHQMTLKDIAFMPQSFEIDKNQSITVYELVATGLWNEISFYKGLNSSQKNRIKNILQKLELWDIRNKLIHELSNGQFQKILFARVLLQDTSFIILDEPFNAIDYATTKTLIDMILECNKKHQKTVIVVIHDLNLVKNYFPKSLLITKDGFEIGNTEDIITKENLLKAKLYKSDYCSNLIS